MEKIGVLLACPTSVYLEEELESRFSVYRLWLQPKRNEFFAKHSDSIRAIVGSSLAGADAALIDALPKLEIISTYSVGLDKIDLHKCKERNVCVTNTPDVLTDDVADLAIALILATMRRICVGDRHVRRGSWPLEDLSMASKFSGKSVGILGLGRIGCAIAKRAEAFGCSINYHSRSKKAFPHYKYYPDVLELAANSHILVVACSLVPETRHIINRAVLDLLGPTGILINIGRGAHVDEPELVSALVERRLGGAGLDVFEHEPNVPPELFSIDNVVLQPHVGSATVETRRVMADLVVRNLEAHFLNMPLLTPVL